MAEFHPQLCRNGLRRLQSSSESSTTETDPLDELSDERKASLFQFLLRDLEVEQVPVLGVDAVETHIFQAALWTTMAEMSENDMEGKVCLVFEDIPVDTLKQFVGELEAIKADPFLTDHVPEMKRFNATLVGKGVGPAIVLATSNRTDVESEAYRSMKRSALLPDVNLCVASLDAFVTRTSPVVGATVSRMVGSIDACDILSGYWTSICELLSLPESEKLSIAVAYPSSTMGSVKKQHDRYASMSIVMNRMATLFAENIRNIHAFPSYDRDIIPTGSKSASIGHLLSSSNAKDKELSAEQIQLENYLRRSPLPCAIIARYENVMESHSKEGAASMWQSMTREELEDAVKAEAEVITSFE